MPVTIAALGTTRLDQIRLDQLSKTCKWRPIIVPVIIAALGTIRLDQIS